MSSNAAINSGSVNTEPSVISPPPGTPLSGGKKKTAAKSVTPSKDRVKVGQANRVVYEGPRGGKYVKVNGEVVPLKKAVAAPKKKAAAKPAPKKKVAAKPAAKKAAPKKK